MIAVPVAFVALEASDQHERPLDPDHAHDIAQHILTSPLVECFLEALREPVIDHGREVLLVDAVVLVGAEQFFGSYESQRIEEFGSDRIVSRLAAIQRQQRNPSAFSAAQHGEQAAMLVVGVRGRMHDARDRAQLQQLLPRACRAAILR